MRSHYSIAAIDKVQLFVTLILIGLLWDCTTVQGPANTPSNPSQRTPSPHFQKEEELSRDGVVVEVRVKGQPKVEVHIYPPGSPPLTMEQFFKTGAPNDFVKWVRKIHMIADKYRLNKWGFRLSAKLSDHCFTISSDWVASDTVSESVPITLDMSSLTEPAPQYKNYVTQGTHYSVSDKADRQVMATSRSVSFYSNSKPNRLVIPKKNYLTLYHFSREATEEEINDLFLHVREQLNSKEANQWSKLGVHTGSKHAQT
ncbi:MAG: hypothetical protein AAFP00_01430, partial [Bacteroidota bacterium]